MTWRRTLPVLVIAALVTTTLGIMPAEARNNRHICRASAARVDLLGGAVFLEPIVANPPAAPCRTRFDSVLTLPPNALLDASVLTALTNTDRANAFVAFAAVPSLGITVTGVQSRAGADCSDGGAASSFGQSSIARITIGADTLIDVNKPVTISLGPLGTVYLNQKIKSEGGGGSVTTQRAVHIETPLGSVTLAEAIAGVGCAAA
jgi:hypothetical protein